MSLGIESHCSWSTTRGYFTTSGYDRNFIFFYFYFLDPLFCSWVGQRLQRVVMPWPLPIFLGRISMQVSLTVCSPCKRFQSLVFFTRSWYGMWCCSWRKIFSELQKKYVAGWGRRSFKGLGLATVRLFTDMHQLLIFRKIHFEGTWNCYSWSLMLLIRTLLDAWRGLRTLISQLHWIR